MNYDDINAPGSASTSGGPIPAGASTGRTRTGWCGR